MTKRKYGYRHLTDEMKSEIDKLVKRLGKEKAYDKVTYNIWVGKVASAMSEDPYAFDVVERTPKGDPYYRFQRNLQKQAMVFDGNDMPIESEMLNYIDSERFNREGWGDYKTISDISMRMLIDELNGKEW